MAKLKPYKDGVYLWKYVPSLALAASFAIAFLVFTLVITFRTIKTRSWFCIAFIIGGLMEAFGYAARVQCVNHTDKLGLYAIQLVLILIAPSLFAATIYMTLSRLMRRLQAEKLSIISARWLTRLFVLGDTLSFLIQVGGGTLATNQKINPDIPKWTILVGLLVQILFFGLFMITAIIFHSRLRNWSSPSALKSDVNWSKTMWMLYVVSGLVLARSIFRVIEYAVGAKGYFFEHEWPLYAFDAGLMVAAMIIWSIVFPGNLKRRPMSRKLMPEEEIPMYQGANTYGY